jgi:hypothetical protein
MIRATLLTFLVASTLHVQAQTERMGPKAGIGIAAQSVGGLFENMSNPMAAPTLGWHFELPVHEQVSIMPEILWLTKGATVRNPALATRARFTFRYIEVPLLVKISTDPSPGGLFITAGPSFGYFVSGRFQNWLNNELIQDFKYNLRENERRFQTSAALGMGYEWSDWIFEIRAQTSISPFDPFMRIQNQVYTATMGWRLPVK